MNEHLFLYFSRPYSMMPDGEMNHRPKAKWDGQKYVLLALIKKDRMFPYETFFRSEYRLTEELFL